MQISSSTSVTLKWDVRLEQGKKSIYTSWIALDQQTWMKFALEDLDNWMKLSPGTLFAILCNVRRADVGPEDCKRQTLNQF